MSETKSTGPSVEFTITRTFEASRERVFRAWTDPARFSQWFGPKGFTTPQETISLDTTPGAAWSARMVSPEGQEATIAGFYREAVEPERLVFTTGDPDNDKGDLASVVTVTFTDLGGRTEMRFHQAGYNTSEEHAKGAEAGWVQFFDRLADHLTT
ncbi:SRPBCC domain-containing protein [Actinomadura sp. HBU206391]|uniref:SRPBCC family protein n=1 Tax=Actinomadura sp. HBU206391 TaxID=2731692 RepID=UPI00164FFB59|nr:SRPBCC domain-containing protein [Actinomadura sp. HBU206391]MBC6459751.1 SRPBCC domain-containing protein [Actinomadura sp. HBU206391]